MNPWIYCWIIQSYRLFNINIWPTSHSNALFVSEENYHVFSSLYCLPKNHPRCSTLALIVPSPSKVRVLWTSIKGLNVKLKHVAIDVVNYAHLFFLVLTIWRHVNHRSRKYIILNEFEEFSKKIYWRTSHISVYSIWFNLISISFLYSL